jgi:hypothetical protein
MAVGLRAGLLPGLLALTSAASGGATEFSFPWSGVLENIAYGPNTSHSVFNGIPVGTAVSGLLRYDDSACASGCPATGPQRSDFAFTENSSATLEMGPLTLSHPVAQSTLSVSILNDAVFPSGLRPFISALSGRVITDQTRFDAWTIATQRVVDFSTAPGFGFAYVSFDTALYTDTSYRSAPDPGDVDLIYFFATDGPFLNVYYAGGRTDIDGDGVANLDDNCPRAPNPDQADGDTAPRGNACLCGDQNRDGRVNVADIVAANLAIFNPPLATALCDANGDGLCNVADLVGINLEIFSGGETATCALQPCPALQLVCP